jgi:hypothetical protein
MGLGMATNGSASKRTLIIASFMVIVSGCSGSSASSSAATAAASLEPSPSATSQSVTDKLNGGSYLFGPFGDKASVTLVATGPDGWVGYPDWAMDGPEPVRADAPKGIGISFLTADGVYTDPCHWDWNDTGHPDVADVKVGPSVDELVAALRANTYYTSTVAKPVTIDGYSGQELELHMPGGSYDRCDKDDPNDPGGHVFPFSGGPGLYTQGPANRWQLYILDVNGTRLISVILSYAKTPQADLDLADKIIQTMNIDAGSASA